MSRRVQALATRAREKTRALLPWHPAPRPKRLDTSTGLATLGEVETFILFLKQSLARVPHQHLGTPDPCAHCTTMYVIEQLERQLGVYREPTDRKAADDSFEGQSGEAAR